MNLIKKNVRVRWKGTGSRSGLVRYCVVRDLCGGSLELAGFFSPFSVGEGRKDSEGYYFLVKKREAKIFGVFGSPENALVRV
uniref:Uncharacterized protein n=1 Tax=Solanum lycopersicum TaxID=4081 RepID=A0A3Q7IE33_SOLLC